MFVTVLYGLYNTRLYTLSYTNAGHTRPLLLRPSTGCCSSLFDANLPMGMFEHIDFSHVEMELQQGTCCCCIPTGLTRPKTWTSSSAWSI